MNKALAQRAIREMVPRFLGLQEAHLERRPTGPMKVSGPSTMTELSDALRNPLPLPPAPKPSRNALEAFASWKPLTMEMVRDLMAKERAARDVLMREYTERTGQAVNYCDECNLGVVEEEEEAGWQTLVVPTPCQACDGLGVVKL